LRNRFGALLSSHAFTLASLHHGKNKNNSSKDVGNEKGWKPVLLNRFG
jgi:hypothetical protein